MTTAPLLSGGASHIALPEPTRLATPRGPLEYADTGQGPALLCLHGGMGGYDQSWLLARALLGDRTSHRVLALSRPGYLRTPRALGTTPVDQADLYAQLLDRLNIERTLVAAVSGGGASALQFALRHADRCSGLILVSAVAGPLETAGAILPRLRKLAWISRIPGLSALLRHRAARRTFANTLRSIPDPDLASQTLLHPEAGPLLRTVQRLTLTQLAARLPGTIADTLACHSMPDLPMDRLAMPILAIHGDADPVVPVHHARRLLAAAPNACGLVVPGGGHMVLFSHLETIRAELGTFLRQPGRP